MIDWQILTIPELHPGFGVEIEAVHKHTVVVKMASRGGVWLIFRQYLKSSAGCFSIQMVCWAAPQIL